MTAHTFFSEGLENRLDEAGIDWVKDSLDSTYIIKVETSFFNSNKVICIKLNHDGTFTAYTVSSKVMKYSKQIVVANRKIIKGIVGVMGYITSFR